MRVILLEGLRLWYSGWGQVIVVATCPLILAPVTLAILYYAPIWTPDVQRFVAEVLQGWTDFRESINWCVFRVHMTITAMRNWLIKVLAGDKVLLQRVEMLGGAPASSRPVGGRKELSSDSRWQRPARLWRRIVLAFPNSWTSWVSLATLCSLASFAYAISLEVIYPYQLWARPKEDLAGEMLLSLWTAVMGLWLSVANFFSVLAIPVTALQARGLWIEIRQRWVQQQHEERRYLLAKKTRVYETGTIIPDKPRGRAPALDWKVVSQWFREGRIFSVKSACESIRNKPLYLQRQRLPTGCFYILERKRRGWRISLPVRGEREFQIKVRRPAIQRVEVIRQGEQKWLHEGDIVTFEDEQWYLVIGQLHPE